MATLNHMFVRVAEKLIAQTSSAPLEAVRNPSGSHVLAFSFFLASFDMPIQISRHKTIRSGRCCLNLCKPAPQTTYILWKVFPFNKVKFVIPVQESHKVRSISTFQNSLIRFPAIHPDLCELSWSRQHTSVELGIILLSERGAAIEVQCDDDNEVTFD